MLAIIIMTAMVLVVGGFMMSRQSFYSNLLHAVWTIVAAMLAFNYFEPLADVLRGLGPMGMIGAEAVALGAIFAISMIVLREVADRLIRGNMNFPLLVERVGGGITAFTGASVMVGMVFLILQLSPLSAKLLGFERCPSPNDPSADKAMFPYADSLTVGLVKNASAGAFAGETAFSRLHPDFLREQYFKRLALDPGSRRQVSGKSIRIKSVTMHTESLVDLDGGEVSPGVGEAFLLMDVELVTKGQLESTVLDKDHIARFVMGHFRLLGWGPEDKPTESVVRYPVAIVRERAIGLGAKQIPLNEAPEEDILEAANDDLSKISLRLAFAWPEDLKKNPPRMLEFKRGVQLKVPAIGKQGDDDTGEAANN